MSVRAVVKDGRVETENCRQRQSRRAVGSYIVFLDRKEKREKG